MPSFPNMNLVVPDPSSTPGPLWATEEVQAFKQIDAHDHSPGKGVPVTPAGLNIDQDLDLNGNQLLQALALFLVSQLAGVDGTKKVSIQTDGTDLWFVDGNGFSIQLTANGFPTWASSSGKGIGGSYSTDPRANFSYSTTFKLLSFWADQVGGILAGIVYGTRVSANRVLSGAYTILDTDLVEMWLLNNVVPFNVTLPQAAAHAGQYFTFKNTTNGQNVFLLTQGSDKIDNGSTALIGGLFGCVHLYCDGSNYWIV